MTAPRFAGCRCGHSHVDHEALAPQCSATHCTCLRYMPATAVQTPKPTGLASVPAASLRPTAVQPTEPTAEQLLAAGKRSHAKRTVALAGKIADQLADLRARLLEERAGAEERAAKELAQAVARKQIADLEAQLAKAKAVLRGDRTPPSTKSTPSGPHVCPDCAKSFPTSQGRGAHRAHAHGYRRPA